MASEAKHTEGPWTATKAKFPVDGEFDYGIHCVVGGEPYVVAEAFGRAGVHTRPNAEANARLISAAPDLYAALKEMVEWWETEGGRLEDSLSRAKAALEKAEGIGP